LFYNKAEYEGECIWDDKDVKSYNYNRPRYARELCVKIDDDWYNVDTVELFDEWWEEVEDEWDDEGSTNELQYGGCNGNEDTIEIYHYDDDYYIFCMSIPVGNDDELHVSWVMLWPSFLCFHNSYKHMALLCSYHIEVGRGLCTFGRYIRLVL